MAIERSHIESVLHSLPAQMTQEDIGSVFFAILSGFKVPPDHAANICEAVIEELEDLTQNPESYCFVPFARKS